MPVMLSAAEASKASFRAVETSLCPPCN